MIRTQYAIRIAIHTDEDYNDQAQIQNSYRVGAQSYMIIINDLKEKIISHL